MAFPDPVKIYVSQYGIISMLAFVLSGNNNSNQFLAGGYYEIWYCGTNIKGPGHLAQW